MLIKRILLSEFSKKGSICLNSLANSNHSILKTKKFAQPIHLNTSFLYRSFTFAFSKQKLIDQLQKLQKQIDITQSTQRTHQQTQLPNKNKKDLFQQKQQRIIKDFLQLTQQSFNDQLKNELQQKYQTDPHILLMIISSLENHDIIRESLVKIYPFVNVLQKEELLLLFQLVLTYRPKQLPVLNTLMTRPLQGIQSLLLILSELYTKDEKLLQWIRQIPLYKGSNTLIVASGFLSIYQSLDQHLKFKNQGLLTKCMNRIINLAIDQDQQTKISIAVLAFQSVQTCMFGEKYLIDIEQISFDQVDPFKVQLLFILMHKHIYTTYQQVRKQIKNKTKFKVVQQSAQGEMTQTFQDDYQLKNEASYDQITDIQRYQYLNRVLKILGIKIMDMNWKQTIKVNLLLEYWKIFELFPEAYPWTMLKAKLIDFTNQKCMNEKLQSLTVDEIIGLLEVMEKLRINKSYLLFKCLALLSQRLDVLESYQLIKLSKICVTYVRQCEDYLIGLRRQIQKRKFIFKDQEINQLNEIFKRVLVLFPRPLAK